MNHLLHSPHSFGQHTYWLSERYQTLSFLIMLRFCELQVLFGMMCNPCGFHLHICFECVFGLRIISFLDVDSKLLSILSSSCDEWHKYINVLVSCTKVRMGSWCLLHPFMALRFSKAEHPHLTWILTLSYSCWYMCIVYPCLVAIICIILPEGLQFVWILFGYLGIDWIIRSKSFLLDVGLGVLNLVHSILSSGCDEWHKNIHV